MDWETIFHPNPNVYIIGNPPFIGQKEKAQNRQQVEDAKLVWGEHYNGYLDYVACWYKKAADYYGYAAAGQFAFVSTNSIAQGQPVQALFRPLFETGWRVFFAHQTFAWNSEAPGMAHVHVVIVGMEKGRTSEARLFLYPNINAAPVEIPARRINNYLVDAPVTWIAKRMRCLSPILPDINSGSTAFDWGYLTLDPDGNANEFSAVTADPIASKYLYDYTWEEKS